MEREVSVIIPVYNRTDRLRKAVESVLGQTYQGFELIVVDDGSDEDIHGIVKSYDREIAYLRHDENRGPSAARNSGIRASKLEFLAFLDSDDWFDKRKLAIQLDVMKKEPSYLISHTEEIWYRRGKLLSQKKKHRKEGGHIFEKCLPLCAISMSTAMMRRVLFDRLGLLDEELPCCEDYDFWLRVCAKYPVLLIDEPLTMKDGGRADQVSSVHRAGMDKFRIRALVKILESGNLDKEQYRLSREELARKCEIYGKGCLKHGKSDEGNYYLSLPAKYNR